MQDTIQREITIKASKQRVYDAVTQPDQIIKWFPDAVEGKLEVGEQPIFNFGEHGKNQIYIVAMQPHDYFAYRWVPGASHFIGDVLSATTTLVEFKIVENNGVTTITVTETGFAQLPKELAESSFPQNSGGWEFMMSRLEKIFLEV